jgi:hypothetical protein
MAEAASLIVSNLTDNPYICDEVTVVIGVNIVTGGLWMRRRRCTVPVLGRRLVCRRRRRLIYLIHTFSINILRLQHIFLKFDRRQMLVQENI